MSPHQVGWLSVAVISVVPPSSEIADDDRFSVTVGASSSFEIKIRRRVDTSGANPPTPELISALPVVTFIQTHKSLVAPSSSASLSTAMTWTTPVLVVSPAANVSTVFALIR